MENQPSLERFLKFSDEDLATNRDGRLSSGQTWRLRWSAAWRLVVGPPLIVAGTVIALLVDVAFQAVIGLVAAGVGLYVSWRGFGFLVDSVDGAVAFVTGTLLGRQVHSRNATYYFADVGPVTKRINFNAYLALPKGLDCHLYYAPGCRGLLSIEPASAAEPRPAHPFGPDSAHVWDRLRWSWVLMTVGALGILIGAHAIAVAHPAHAIRVDGTVADYVETHGKSTSRTLSLAGDPNSYKPMAEDTYSPPAPPFSTLIGREVAFYVNAGTSDVIALNDGEQMHAGDWYLHPDHQTRFEIVNGALTVALAAVILLVGVALLVVGNRRALASAAADSSRRRALYAPPTIRSARATLPRALVAGLVVVGVVAFFALALASAK